MFSVLSVLEMRLWKEIYFTKFDADSAVMILPINAHSYASALPFIKTTRV